MKKVWIGGVIVIIAVLAIILSARTKPESTEIKIGVILPLTGDLSEPGTKSLNGIRLALDTINETNSKIQIKYIVEDSKANPIDGVNAINKLINIDNVKFVIGDMTSGVTLAIAPIAEKKHVVILAPGASNPKIRQAGDYIFRNWAADNFDGEVMAMYLMTKMAKKNAVIIYVNNEYGVGLAQSFEETFIKNGGSIVFKETYEQGTSDFRSIIVKIQNHSFDCIYLPGHPKENGLFVKQLKENGIDVTLASNLSVESPDFLKNAEEAAEGIIFSTPMFDDTSNDFNTKKFLSQYESRFNAKPDTTAGHGYDAANIFFQALKMANYDVNEVKNMLYRIKNFPGVTGQTTFDSFGDVSKSVMIKKLVKGNVSIKLETFEPK